MTEFLLKGLDGGNPLGFLAALGTLRVSALAWAGWRFKLSWSDRQGGWRPILQVDKPLEQDDWLQGLNRQLKGSASLGTFDLADDLNIPVTAFRLAARKAAGDAEPGNRSHADFLAAFGSEIVQAEANGKKTGEIADTAFRTMSGAGHQHFLGFMRELVKATEAEHLRAALFETWSYSDPGPSLRWDPGDDRRYALRWQQPSGDPVKTVRGANRLALEGLPLLPTAPVGGKLETTGFTQRRGLGAIWSWPIWATPIGLDTVRSLLALADLQETRPDRRRLTDRGIVEIYRCQRITQGKYRNFTPARPA